MQYVGQSLDLLFLTAASNDNDDLLAFASPSVDLDIIQRIKQEMHAENAQTGILLTSRKQRQFFQEVVDAERYILLRYFTIAAPELVLRKLKRRILDNYLFPKRRRPSRH